MLPKRQHGHLDVLGVTFLVLCIFIGVVLPTDSPDALTWQRVLWKCFVVTGGTLTLVGVYTATLWARRLLMSSGFLLLAAGAVEFAILATRVRSILVAVLCTVGFGVEALRSRRQL
jgi:hypothetical protein